MGDFVGGAMRRRDFIKMIAPGGAAHEIPAGHQRENGKFAEP
jgi:hypothetical protein